MNTISVSKQFRWKGKVTQRIAAVMRMFGLSLEKLKRGTVTFDCDIKISPGDVVFVTGPSGAGKSVLLGELYNKIAEGEKIRLGDIELSQDKTVIDCIGGDLLSAIKVLSVAGLNDVVTILQKPAHLSEGQKWRFRLAVALSSSSDFKYIFADEFCSNLDRITAAVIAHNIYKYAKRNQVSFVLAASNDDVLADLWPDTIVSRTLAGKTEVVYRLADK